MTNNILTFLRRKYDELDRTQLSSTWSPFVPIITVFIYLVTFSLLADYVRPKTKFLKLLASPQIFFLLSLLILAPALRIKLSSLGLSGQNIAGNIVGGLKLSLIPPALVIVFVFIPVSLFEIYGSGETTVLADFAGGQIPADGIFMIQLLLLAPIFEEIFFRGFVIPPLKKILPLWATVLFSSLIFMLAHGYYKPGAFLLGIFTSVIFIRSGSVIPAAIFHFSCNLWGPLLVWLAPGAYGILYPLFK